MSTLEWVRNGLDDTDPATLTAVPVLVIAESGGAASDIWRYCSPESDTYLELPKVDSRHDEAYVAACARLLPDIEELGKQTGTNSTQQMTFYSIDPDPDADNDNDLILAIQTALLNDCPDINQEAMLAVAWGQAHCTPLTVLHPLACYTASPCYTPYHATPLTVPHPLPCYTPLPCHTLGARRSSCSGT